jgi:prepilin-type N-terminal cleavage/methylation domain-containing protein
MTDTRRRGTAASGRRRVRGFTLIELLIAAALLAVLAVLSWRGLDSVLASRQRIVAASDELRSLTLAFAQLDEDLRRSWPVRLLRLPTPSITFAVAGEQAAASLQLLRETAGATEPTQVQRVAWRLRDGVLERGFGAWVAPSAAAVGAFGSVGAGGPSGAGSMAGPGREQGPGGQGGEGEPGALVWQPVLGKVESLQMQGWITGQGWVAAEALAGQLRGADAQQAPAAGTVVAVTPAVTGLLLRVVRTDGRVLQRVFPVKD